MLCSIVSTSLDMNMAALLHNRIIDVIQSIDKIYASNSIDACVFTYYIQCWRWRHVIGMLNYHCRKVKINEFPINPYLEHLYLKKQAHRIEIKRSMILITFAPTWKINHDESVMMCPSCWEEIICTLRWRLGYHLQNMKSKYCLVKIWYNNYWYHAGK